VTAQRVGLAAFVLSVGIIVSIGPVSAYSLFFIRPTPYAFVAIRWPESPIDYWIRVSDHPALPTAALRDFVGRATADWESTPTADISFRFRGLTTRRTAPEFNIVSAGDLDSGTLGVARFFFTLATGEIFRSNIEITTDATWDLHERGPDYGFDLSGVIVHEFGHLVGLMHSGVGESTQKGSLSPLASGSVMWPIAFDLARTQGLTADDRAGVSVLYPTPEFHASTGTIAGRLMLDGRAVGGGQVTAFDPATGDLIGAISADEGRFEIGGLAPGPKLLRAEPLDEISNISKWVNSTFTRYVPVELDFRPTFHDEYVWVHPGQTTGEFVFEVDPL